MQRQWLYGTALVFLFLTRGFSADAPQSPVAPDESLQYFVTHPDCRIELVAAEPDVMSPIQVAFDPDGRMWVMEYSDYPNGPAEGEPGRSRIRILTDDNGDGRFENPQVFVDKLLFATGLAFWRDGVIVTSQGSVDFLRDTDGDGRCDDRQCWFRGFSAENPQLRANAPTFAYDNHFYIASGLRGGKVVPAREDWAKDAQPVDLSGRDFRFDPITGQCEAVTGPSQFGIAIDDYGNRFTCDNRHPCTHVVIEDRYVRRNPKLAIPSLVQDVAMSGEQSRVYPISKFWTTSNLHEGQFTAACGICNYRGNALPSKFVGQHFVCDPTGNFVHCEILTPNGATFTSKPEREGVEFLASTDPWFRPVNLTVGPDGALYLVDMYRAVIEHPEWMPTELKNRPDLLLGVDRGRIYRLVTKDAPAGKPVLKESLRILPSAELVRNLTHPNVWWRETAHRLLFEQLTERRNLGIVGLLKGPFPYPQTIEMDVRRLWLLHGSGELDSKTLDAALGDANTIQTPRLVDQAARIAEDYEPAVARSCKLAGLAADSYWKDPQSAFQCVLSLSAFPLPDEVIPLLAKAACRYADDPWMCTAVALTARDDAAKVLTAALDLANHDPRIAPLVRILAEQVGAVGNVEAAGKLLDLNSRTRNVLWAELILGLAAGAQRSGGWQAFHDKLPPAAHKVCDLMFSDAADRTMHGGSDLEQAIALLRLAPWEISAILCCHWRVATNFHGESSP
ncbi:MAG: PVC-type heme-binding CxxCH protein [Planctomycetaceae bacterium]